MTVRALGILASAGTGKTHRLTNELIGLYLAGRPPQSVFAATFTRAAAGEILDRVLLRLCGAATRHESLEELGKSLGTSTLTAEHCLRAVASLGRSIDRVAVWTIDSFLVRVATAFSTEIGLAPGWRILGDDEDERLRRTAIDRVLRQGGRDAILPLLRMLKKSEGERSVRQSIIDVVQAVYAAHLNATPEAWNAVVPEGQPLTQAQVAQSIESLGQAPVPATKKNEPNKRWLEGRQRAVEAARGGDWESFLAGGMPEKFRSTGMYSGVPFPEGFSEPLGSLVRHAGHVVVRDAMHRNLAAAEIARRFSEEYGRMKVERGSLLFDDIPRLLSSEAITGGRDDLYYRLDARIEHVLLDEFQDTSVRQFNVIEPLIDEIVSDETRPRTFFYVGDAKQSLYAWREAEPELLGHVAGHWPQVSVERITTSFRSSSPVIDAVNEVFVDLGRNPAMADGPAAGAASDFLAMFSRHSPGGKAANRRGKVMLREYPPIPGEERARSDLATARCEFIARRVADIRAAAPEATVGVLVRTKTSVSRLLVAMSEIGIDASEEGGSAITQSPAAAAVVSLLRLADHPGDTLSAFHVATTPLGELVGLARRQDPAAIFAISESLREQLSRHGFGITIERWVMWLAPFCPEIDRTRLRQVAQTAWEYDRRGGASVRGLIELIESTRRPAGVPSPVRIMTIHSAKGLEFDAVVAPDLGGAVPQRRPEVLTHREGPFGPLTRLSLAASEAICLSSPALSEMADQRRRRDIREALCLLYVTMTRARLYLEMIIPPPPKDEPTAFRLSHVVRNALGGTADPDGVLFESGSDQWPLDLEAKPASTAGRDSRQRVVLGLAMSSTAGAGVSPSEASNGPDADEPPLVRAGDSRSARLAKGIGVALHACLERVTWIEDGLPSDEDWRLAVERTELPFDVDARRIVDLARRVVAARELRDVLSRGRYPASQEPGCSVELHREVSLGAVNDEGRVVRARIDRLVVVRRHGVPIEAEVIDWKSDSIELDAPDVAVQRRVATHRPQLLAYRRLVSKHLGVQAEQVRATLVFTSIPRAVGIDPE